MCPFNLSRGGQVKKTQENLILTTQMYIVATVRYNDTCLWERGVIPSKQQSNKSSCVNDFN